jgi:hypothetical protein
MFTLTQIFNGMIDLKRLTCARQFTSTVVFVILMACFREMRQGISCTKKNYTTVVF